ncbi:hypothetical protein EVAR_68242_1, partial [Eumeta japonica]
SSSDSVLTTSSLSERIQNLQINAGIAPPVGAVVQSSDPPPLHTNTLKRNKSALHGGDRTGLTLGGSMTSLSSAPPTPTPAASLSTSDLSERPIRPSHGKPHLAPKPPILAPASPTTTDTRPSPPPKKLIMNGKVATRAQSMRVPRSPPVSPPSPQPPTAHAPPPVATKHPASHFGTLRATRAVLRPPGVCPPPPPGPPPPPPPARHTSLSTPPPPPHRQMCALLYTKKNIPRENISYAATSLRSNVF